MRRSKLRGSAVRAWWDDPRTGEATCLGEFANQGEATFVPPTPGENSERMLVLDSIDANRPPPGSRAAQA